MNYYKQTTVEQAPVNNPKLGKAPKAPRLIMNPDGTLSPIEDHLNWDFDKRNSD